MTTNIEIMPALAEEIAKHHESTQALASQARDILQQAMTDAVRCGDYIDQAESMQKGRLLAWLRDNVPNLTPQKAKAYLSAFHTQQKRTSFAIGHKQLVFLEVIGLQEAKGLPSRSNDKDCKWVGWIGNLRGYFTDTLKARPVSQWTTEEREAVADQLKPLVELYQKLQ